MNVGRVVLAVVMLGGAALAVAAAIQRRRERLRRLSQWSRVSATVVQARETTASSSYASTEYLLRFTTESGATIESWQTTSDHVHLGDLVDIVYDPAKPNDFELARSGFAGTMMLTFFAFLLVWFAVHLLANAAQP